MNSCAPLNPQSYLILITPTVTGGEDARTLLANLDVLLNWSKINPSKWICMNIGDAKVNNYSTEEGSVLFVLSHNVLGVAVSHNFKITARCRAVEAEGFRTIWTLGWTFTRLDISMSTTVYTTLVGFKVEDCV